MKQIDLTGKCGSCWYFRQIEGTASGECRKFPYGDDVCHDPKHPYFMPTRSRPKCKLYRATPLSNYDLLISKTPEELAKFITDVDLCELLCGSPPVCDGYWCCEPKMLLWLKSPVEDDK